VFVKAVGVRDYIAFVTDEDDMEHWWNDGWGVNRVIKTNSCTSALFPQLIPHGLVW